MTALSHGRRTPMRAGDLVSHPIAAATDVFSGGLACLDASGDLVPGSTATGLTCIGVFEESVANANGAAGDLAATVRRDGAWRFDNDSGDPVTRAEIGGNAWIVDDQTVAATDGTGTRSAAGRIVDLDAVGVWIEFK